MTAGVDLPNQLPWELRTASAVRETAAFVPRGIDEAPVGN